METRSMCSSRSLRGKRELCGQWQSSSEFLNDSLSPSSEESSNVWNDLKESLSFPLSRYLSVVGACCGGGGGLHRPTNPSFSLLLSRMMITTVAGFAVAAAAAAAAAALTSAGVSESSQQQSQLSVGSCCARSHCGSNKSASQRASRG